LAKLLCSVEVAAICTAWATGAGADPFHIGKITIARVVAIRHFAVLPIAFGIISIAIGGSIAICVNTDPILTTLADHCAVAAEGPHAVFATLHSVFLTTVCPDFARVGFFIAAGTLNVRVRAGEKRQTQENNCRRDHRFSRHLKNLPTNLC